MAGSYNVILKRVFLLLVLLLSVDAEAQVETPFEPLKLHSSRSKELIDKLIVHLNNEYKNIGRVTNKPKVQQICANRSMFILKLVNAKSFIDNDSIENKLGEIVKRIVVSNDLDERERIILIMNRPEANAMCYGRGTFIVTIGLLSRIKTEDELAFILSHELAHDELRHVQTRIKEEADLRTAHKINKQLGNIIFGETTTVEEIETFRKYVYKISEFGRENEIDADSVGFELFRNAKYNEQEAAKALFTLDSANYPKYDSKEHFFSAFDFPKYPFKEYWLNKRLSVYMSKPGDTFLFSSDSLKSHPNLDVRREILSTYSRTESQRDSFPVKIFSRDIVVSAEFQVVESAYISKQYDQALYQILQLVNKYPKSGYLISRAGKILLDIGQAKNDQLFDGYVSRFTGDYKERMRQVNNFLYNITDPEISELTFHFMNNQSNFNPEIQSHYYLLWKTCLRTHREQVADKIKEAFKDKFGKSISSFTYE
ncbi:MAG: hypothetical protein C0490_08800 [Marivirga sp.]|nr:hypothetical protein [Marivirga sp.]